MKYVRAYIDTPRLGCGYRDVFVVKEGRKWARVFYPVTAQGIDIPIETLAKATELPAVDRREANTGHGYIPKRAARRIRDTLAYRKRLGLATSEGDAKAVIRELEVAA